MKKEEVLSRHSERLRETGLGFTLSSLLAIAALFVFVASVYNAPPVEADKAENANPSAAGSVVQPSLQDEVHIKLTSNGFVPGTVEHTAGTFAFAVENETLSGEYTLRLKAADGTILREVNVQKGSSAWSITLQAGQYTLTEAQNPQWLCRITVQ
jgi:hypothetical protein